MKRHRYCDWESQKEPLSYGGLPLKRALAGIQHSPLYLGHFFALNDD